jgi:HSP20 family protein
MGEGGATMNELEIKKEGKPAILPVCSICGDEATVTLSVEMPGVRKDDIEVRIDGDQLVITGKPQEEGAEGAWLLRERRQGAYERRFTIDTTIDRDRIDAVFERGIMTLSLRVKEEVKPRRVEISSR